MTLVRARSVPTIRNINNSRGKLGKYKIKFLTENSNEQVQSPALVGKGEKKKKKKGHKKNRR